MKSKHLRSLPKDGLAHDYGAERYVWRGIRVYDYGAERYVWRGIRVYDYGAERGLNVLNSATGVETLESPGITEAPGIAGIAA